MLGFAAGNETVWSASVCRASIRLLDCDACASANGCEASRDCGCARLAPSRYAMTRPTANATNANSVNAVTGLLRCNREEGRISNLAHCMRATRSGQSRVVALIKCAIHRPSRQSLSEPDRNVEDVGPPVVAAAPAPV